MNKSILLNLRVWYDPQSKHIKLAGAGLAASTVSNDPKSKRYHANLYRKLARPSPKRAHLILYWRSGLPRGNLNRFGPVSPRHRFPFPFRRRIVAGWRRSPLRVPKSRCIVSAVGRQKSHAMPGANGTRRLSNGYCAPCWTTPIATIATARRASSSARFPTEPPLRASAAPRENLLRKYRSSIRSFC